MVVGLPEWTALVPMCPTTRGRPCRSPPPVASIADTTSTAHEGRTQRKDSKSTPPRRAVTYHAHLEPVVLSGDLLTGLGPLGLSQKDPRRQAALDHQVGRRRQPVVRHDQLARTDLTLPMHNKQAAG